MTKKKKNNNANKSNVRHIQIKDGLHKNKYINTMLNVAKDENDINDMIGAMAVVNAQLLIVANNESEVEKQADEIIEAYHWAYEKTMTSNSKRRKVMENWFGDLPLLFRMGSVLEFEKEKKRINFEYTLLDDEQKKMFSKIINSTWKVREDRRIVVDGTCGIFIPKTVPKENLDDMYYMAKDIVQTFLLADSAVLTFALERKDGHVISCLLKDKDGFHVVNKETVEWSYTHDAVTGELIEAPEGEKYVDFVFT